MIKIMYLKSSIEFNWTTHKCAKLGMFFAGSGPCNLNQLGIFCQNDLP